MYKRGDRMKLFRNTLIVLLLISVLLFCCACGVPKNFENETLRQHTETMLDAIMQEDVDTAYALLQDVIPEKEFSTAFGQLRSILGEYSSYELQLTYVQTNVSATGNGKVTVINHTYDLMTDSGRYIINVQCNDQISGLSGFYIAPYENTDASFTGAIGHMQGANVLQWILLVSNVLSLALVIVALIDCCKCKIKRKWVLILLILLGAFSVGGTFASDQVRINFNFGWMNYTALLCYGSGKTVLRLMLPVGAIGYLSMRRTLTVPPPQETEQIN